MARLADARRSFEYQTFDFVLCEQNFPLENAAGQDLLNDLRRNQLLPFSTVFVMITGEATYAKVAEAAESAPGWLPAQTAQAVPFSERLQQARVRKISLAEIFAGDEADFFRAAKLCVARLKAAACIGCMPPALVPSCCCASTSPHRPASSTTRSSRPRHFHGPSWA